MFIFFLRIKVLLTVLTKIKIVTVIRITNNDKSIYINTENITNKPCKHRDITPISYDKKVHDILTNSLDNKKSFCNFINFAGLEASNVNIRSVNFGKVANGLEQDLHKKIEEKRLKKVRKYVRTSLREDVNGDVNLNRLFDKLNEYLEIEKMKINSIANDVVLPQIISARGVSNEIRRKVSTKL